MVSSFTPNKRIEQPDHNEYIDRWDIPVNADWAIIDLALGSGVNINLTGLSGNQTLTAAQYQPLKLILAGAPTAATNIVIPSGVGGLWVVRNNTTGGFVIAIFSAAGGSSVTIPAGTNTLVTCDGSATGMFLAINTTPSAAGANTNVQFNSSGILGGSAGLTWDGTTLLTTGLNNTGSTVLGDNPGGDTLTINGTGISTPNGAVFNTNQLVLGATPFNQVAIGTATPAAGVMLTVAGSIQSTAGGYVFPDGTIQTTAFSATGLVSDYVGGTLPPGWVWANGTTVGNASSNATGRANPDTQALFTLMWNWAQAQAQLYDSAGVAAARGANALADWNANRAIAVPDLRGRVVSGMDIIGGSTNTGRLSSYIASTTPGAAGGQQSEAANINIPQLTLRIGYWASPPQSSAASASVSGTTDGPSVPNIGSANGPQGTSTDGHVHNWSGGIAWNPAGFGAYGLSDAAVNTAAPGYNGTTTAINVQPTMVMNKIIKL